MHFSGLGPKLFGQLTKLTLWQRRTQLLKMVIVNLPIVNWLFHVISIAMLAFQRVTPDFLHCSLHFHCLPSPFQSLRGRQAEAWRSGEARCDHRWRSPEYRQKIWFLKCPLTFPKIDEKHITLTPGIFWGMRGAAKKAAMVRSPPT